MAWNAETLHVETFQIETFEEFRWLLDLTIITNRVKVHLPCFRVPFDPMVVWQLKH